MLLAEDDPARKAGAEQVAPPGVTGVERLRVAAIQALDASREPLARRLDDEVIVGRHQAEPEAAPVALFHGAGEEGEEVAKIVVVQKDLRVSHAPCRDVKEAVREVASGLTRHEVDASSPPGPRNVCGQGDTNI
jgi:hypothetical protein